MMDKVHVVVRMYDVPPYSWKLTSREITTRIPARHTVAASTAPVRVTCFAHRAAPRVHGGVGRHTAGGSRARVSRAAECHDFPPIEGDDGRVARGRPGRHREI